jgi:hypothetical protein
MRVVAADAWDRQLAAEFLGVVEMGQELRDLLASRGAGEHRIEASALSQT